MAQSIKYLTPNFTSGHDLKVREFEPHIGLCTDSAVQAQDVVSLPLPHSCTLTLKINLRKKTSENEV